MPSITSFVATKPIIVVKPAATRPTATSIKRVIM